MWLWSTIASSLRPRASLPAHRQQVERALEIAGAQGEVALVDRRHEALVERARQPQRRVHAVPAELSAQARARAACARGTRPSSRTSENTGASSSAYSPGVYSRTCHGIAGSLGARRRERETVRSAHVGDAAGREQCREPLQQRARLLACARSSGGTRSRPTAPRRRSPRPARARSGGSGACSAAARARAPRDSRPRPPRRRPAPPAPPRRSPPRMPCPPRAGPRSDRRSSGRRPGAAGTSSSPPARRGACARRSARAAARRGAGCAEDRWSREARRRASYIPRPSHGIDPTNRSSTERIREANVRYHDAAAESYDSKWAIDYGEIGARQVLGKLAKALGPAAGPLSRGRSRSARAQGTSRSTSSAGSRRQRGRNRHLARACCAS